MAHLRNDQVYSYHVEWKGFLEARRKWWSVSFEPLPIEKTSSFALGGWSVRYGERFDHWVVFVVIVPIRESACILVDCKATYTVSPTAR
jgi:hypothetical protein